MYSLFDAIFNRFSIFPVDWLISIALLAEEIPTFLHNIVPVPRQGSFHSFIELHNNHKLYIYINS